MFVCFVRCICNDKDFLGVDSLNLVQLTGEKLSFPHLTLGHDGGENGDERNRMLIVVKVNTMWKETNKKKKKRSCICMLPIGKTTESSARLGSQWILLFCSIFARGQPAAAVFLIFFYKLDCFPPIHSLPTNIRSCHSAIAKAAFWCFYYRWSAHVYHWLWFWHFVIQFDLLV